MFQEHRLVLQHHIVLYYQLALCVYHRRSLLIIKILGIRILESDNIALYAYSPDTFILWDVTHDKYYVCVITSSDLIVKPINIPSSLMLCNRHIINGICGKCKDFKYRDTYLLSYDTTTNSLTCRKRYSRHQTENILYAIDGNIIYVCVDAKDDLEQCQRYKSNTSQKNKVVIRIAYKGNLCLCIEIPEFEDVKSYILENNVLCVTYKHTHTLCRIVNDTISVLWTISLSSHILFHLIVNYRNPDRLTVIGYDGEIVLICINNETSMIQTNQIISSGLPYVSMVDDTIYMCKNLTHPLDGVYIYI